MITVATIEKIAVSMITIEEETLAQEYRKGCTTLVKNDFFMLLKIKM